MSKEILKEQSKCPFTGAGTPPKHPTGKGTSNRDWWPNSLNLKILSQHSRLVNPMDKKCSENKMKHRPKKSEIMIKKINRIMQLIYVFRISCFRKTKMIWLDLFRVFLFGIRIKKCIYSDVHS